MTDLTDGTRRLRVHTARSMSLRSSSQDLPGDALAEALDFLPWQELFCATPCVCREWRAAAAASSRRRRVHVRHMLDMLVERECFGACDEESPLTVEEFNRAKAAGRRGSDTLALEWAPCRCWSERRAAACRAAFSRTSMPTEYAEAGNMIFGNQLPPPLASGTPPLGEECSRQRLLASVALLLGATDPAHTRRRLHMLLHRLSADAEVAMRQRRSYEDARRLLAAVGRVTDGQLLFCMRRTPARTGALGYVALCVVGTHPKSTQNGRNDARQRPRPARIAVAAARAPAWRHRAAPSGAAHSLSAARRHTDGARPNSSNNNIFSHNSQPRLRPA
jgi:hypothetical protein